MEIKKQIFTIIIFCTVVLLMGYVYFSGPIERNDIYAKCIKGDTISFELFKRTERLIRTDNSYFVFLDLYSSEDEDMYAPHIIALNHNFVIKGASGVCPHVVEITSAKDDTLFGISSDEYRIKKQRYSPYRNDLPVNVEFVLQECNINSFKTDNYAIIDSMKLVDNAKKAKLYLRVSDKIGFPGKKRYFEHIDFYSEKFKKTKELIVPVSNLFFSRDRSNVYLCELTIDNDVATLYRSEMYTLNDELIDEFLHEYFRTFN